MKILLLSILTLLSITVNAQNLNKCRTKEQAVDQAATISKETTGFGLISATDQKEDNLLTIGFAPDTKGSQLTFVYKIIRQDDGTTNYVFDYITGSYDTLFKVWQTDFEKGKATKDRKNKKYIDKEKSIAYYFAEDEDERWIINYQPLK